MSRPSVMQKVVGAPGKAPVTAWIFSAVMFGAWAWRYFRHVPGAEETVWHRAQDWTPLALCILAAPGLMEWIAGKANLAIGVYRNYKRAREGKSAEGNSTLPPTRGGGGP